MEKSKRQFTRQDLSRIHSKEAKKMMARWGVIASPPEYNEQLLHKNRQVF
jgi:hypothetical protein